MLARFAVDIKLLSVSKDQVRDDDSLGSRHRRLCKAWRDLGVLVHAAGLSERELLVAIRNLPDGVRPFWDAAWQAGRRRSMRVPWNGVGEPPQPERVRALSDVVDLVCLEDGSVKSIRDALEVGGKVHGPEVCGISSVDMSRTFEQAHRRAEDRIRAGTASADVWEERFKEAAVCARTMRIVDRYAVQDLLSGRGGRKGFENLIRWLSRDAPETAVELYSAKSTGRDGKAPRHSAIQLLGEIRSVLARERSAVVGSPVFVYLTVDRLFSERQHDRYFRFDDQSVAEVGIGCEILGGERVERSSSFSFKSLGSLSGYRDEMRKWEEDARRDRDTTCLRWPVAP